jgi:TolB protein
MRAAVVGVCLSAVFTLVVALPAEATAPGDNGRIAFRRFVEGVPTIFTIRPDGSGERQVATPPAGGADDFPDYASDGSFVAWTRCVEFCSIMVARPDGSGLRRIGPEGTLEDDRTDVGISPDTRRVAFTRNYGPIVGDDIQHSEVFTQKLDGHGLRRITHPPDFVAHDDGSQWSPDGKQIVFRRHFNDGRQAIFTVSAHGGPVRQVTPYSLAAGDGPDWSPDGRRIMFRSPETDDFLGTNLWTIRPDGTGLRQVTHAPPATHVYSASFSPDGKRITLGYEGIGGMADVWTMRTDGSDLRPVTRTPERDSAPDWGGRR